MLSNDKFNEWAKDYDSSVKVSKDGQEYPFAGYDDLMDVVYDSIGNSEKLSVLDIGFGTGKLTERFYKDGHTITGIDFSSEMIKIASKKMDQARFIQFDFCDGLPDKIEGEKFDVILSTYAIHHLENKEKINFINNLKKYLHQDGMILIGDVAFVNREEHNQCKHDAGSLWDDDEVYIVFDEIKNELDYKKVDFKKVSYCAGVLRLSHFL